MTDQNLEQIISGQGTPTKIEDSSLFKDYKKIPTKNKHPRIMFINAPRFGLEYFPEEEFKGVLEYCRIQEADALFITGDLFYIDLKQHSKNKIARIQNQSDLINEDDVYLPRILEEDGWSKEFVTTEEKLQGLKSGLEELFKINEHYKIPIYLVPGVSEYDMALSLTNDEIRSLVAKKRNSIEGVIRQLKNEIKDISKDDTLSDTQKESIIEDKEGIIGELEVYKKRVIMTNFNKSKELYSQKKKEIKDSLEQIPGLTLLDPVARVEINGIPMEIRYNTTQRTDTPAKKTPNDIRNYLISRIREKDEDEVLPRFFAQGGLHGIHSQEPIRDTSWETNEKIDEIIIPCIERSIEKYIFGNLLPPFIKKQKLESAINSEPVMANDAAQRMYKKFKTFSGAILSTFFDESLIYNQVISLEQLSEVYKSEKKEEMINGPVFLKWTQSDRHIGNQHLKKIILTKSERKATAKKLDEKLKYRITSANKVFSILRELIPYIVSESDEGELVHAANYDTHLEKHPLWKRLSKMEEIVCKAHNKESVKEYYKGEIRRLMELEPLSPVELMLLNQSFQNTIRTDEQMEDWIDEEVKSRINSLKDMIEFGERVGYYGPIKVNVNGGHEEHTTREAGITVSEVLSRRMRDILGLTEEDGRILSGDIGQGTGYALYTCGIKEYHDYTIKEFHKGHSTLADQVNAMTEAARREQLTIDAVITGHTHSPVYFFDGTTLFIQNGSTQGSNEWGSKFRLGPSRTTFYLLGLPINGFKKGEITIIPLTLEFAIKALKNQNIVEELMNCLNIYGAEKKDKQ